MVTVAAPRMTPGILPEPPRMTIDRTPIDCMKENDSGLIKVRLAASSTPMIPAKEAPTAKAVSFIRTRGMPWAMAAVSSSLTAVQARPIFESSRRRVT